MYICPKCKEKFDVSKSDILMCPFSCNVQLIQYEKYKKIEEKIKALNLEPEKELEILNSESSILEKIKGTQLDTVIDKIKAMYSLIKDPNAEKKNKLIACVSMLYVITPIDFIPDVILGWGYIDDATAVTIAVGMLGMALEHYCSTRNEKKIEKQGESILYRFHPNDGSNNVSAIIKKDVITWQIPKSKMHKVKIKVIDNKMIELNKLYILNNNIDGKLIPLNNFDIITTDSIFNEASLILKSLGVKSIKSKKEIAIAKNKKGIATIKSMDVFNTNLEVSKGDVKIEKFEEKSSFGEINILNNLVENDFVDKLTWFFTDKSILNENIFYDRLQNMEEKKNITKELEMESILDINSRSSIKKSVDIDVEVSINNSMKIKWTIDVEFYPLNKKDTVELSKIYYFLQSKIERRKQDISCNFK